MDFGEPSLTSNFRLHVSIKPLLSCLLKKKDGYPQALLLSTRKKSPPAEILGFSDVLIRETR